MLLKRSLAVALLAISSACATTGPDAPQTGAETASGAAGGILGAAGGGTLGILAGSIVGFQCGPAFFVCSPIMAVVYGVQGAAKGGEFGAKTGVGLSRRGSEPSPAPAEPETSTVPSDLREFSI